MTRDLNLIIIIEGWRAFFDSDKNHNDLVVELRMSKGLGLQS